MTKRRFHFKLEPIRTLRENAELTVMKELAGELKQAAVLDRELHAVEARLDEARAPELGSVTAADLAVRQAYVERMERELEDARVRARAQERHVEEARLRLASAVRARQTLDRLEARRRAAHQVELQRMERSNADEISLVSHLASENAA